MNRVHFYVKFVQNMLHIVVQVLELQNLHLVKYEIYTVK